MYRHIVVYTFCSPEKRIIFCVFIPGERALTESWYDVQSIKRAHFTFSDDVLKLQFSCFYDTLSDNFELLSSFCHINVIIWAPILLGYWVKTPIIPPLTHHFLWICPPNVFVIGFSLSLIHRLFMGSFQNHDVKF